MQLVYIKGLVLSLIFLIKLPKVFISLGTTLMLYFLKHVNYQVHGSITSCIVFYEFENE